MSRSSASLISVTSGGVTGEHLLLPAPPAFVAPTISGEEHNTIKSSVVPFACRRANDMRFEFESSFVRPEISEEIDALKELIDGHTLTDQQGKPAHRPVLTVFGHADPGGKTDRLATFKGFLQLCIEQGNFL